MNFELTLLGTGAAMPAYGRFPSAHQLSIRGMDFLLDCGEGAQLQLQRYGRNPGNLSHLFITHLHGDHCYGLPGLLSTYQLLGRRDPLYVFSPAGLGDMLDTVLKRSYARLGYPLEVREVVTNRYARIWENDFLEVYTLPLQHRVPCCGYLFREKPHLRTLRPGVVEEFDIPYGSIPGIKKGAAFETARGRVIPNEDLTLPPPPPRSFAYCTDTQYLPGLAPLLRGVDLLYHDATFCEDGRARARETGHSTAAQAARLARDAGAGRLLLGHFSSRYRDVSLFEQEARPVFEASIAGREGMQVEIPYPGRAMG